LASALLPSPAFRTALGDIVPFVIMAAAVYFSARNALDSHTHTRLFWSLMAIGMGMWCFNQACWTWYEVIVREPLPEPFKGDMVLFLHVVPIMAAVAIRPRQGDEHEGMLTSALNVVMLLVWWVVVYAFFVFPQEYIVTDRPIYTLRWDLLYVIEGLMLIAVAGSAYVSSTGPWRKLYGGILAASILYGLASEAMNAAIARGTYHTGSLFDIPFVAAVLGFLGVTIAGRRLLSETQQIPATPRRAVAPWLAQLALLSLPLMGYAALFLTKEPLYLRQIRFAVAMGGVTLLAFVVFLKQHLLDQRLLLLLDDSRKSFENLQRLQGRAVQQAKLASLGELVALAANELEHPLSAILTSSESMAASTHLTREQLVDAQKIGQQARRTRELVTGLLSFAQRTSGEKVPLELKPLLQRAVQMEGLKLDKRNISLTVESVDPAPRVLGDSNQLLQAFVQIVENAVEALQEVGGGRLEISLWSESGDVVIQFADNGPGLRDPERVFDPFYTTKPVGKGTGLGLSATYGVVQEHRGQITCFNRPEGGAAFEIRLPSLRSSVAMAAGEPA
jgi:signal transduction histidine kinase